MTPQNRKLRIVFMGTPEFAVPSLKALIESGENVVSVVTQPDKPKGRGKRIIHSPIKIFAENHGLNVLQPEKIRTNEFYTTLKELKPDLVCVCAYGKILPKNILELPRWGCINVHASLLPKYRGAAPINWTIMRGEKISGITIMQMDEGMDTGDILLQKAVIIKDENTSQSLSGKLAIIGSELLVETLNLLKERNLKPVAQDDSQATYAPMLTKDEGKIDWSDNAEDIRNLVRGSLPWPGAFTTMDNKLLKIFKARVSESTGRPGEVLKSDEGIIRVGTGKGSLDILELQLEGGKKMSSEDFLRGRRVLEGTVLGKITQNNK